MICKVEDEHNLFYDLNFCNKMLITFCASAFLQVWRPNVFFPCIWHRRIVCPYHFHHCYVAQLLYLCSFSISEHLLNEFFSSSEPEPLSWKLHIHPNLMSPKKGLRRIMLLHWLCMVDSLKIL